MVILETNQIYAGDCVELLAQVPEGSVDLVFADPPFNIGYRYDVYNDDRAHEEYLDWCRKWIGGVKRCLNPAGTFWLAIGDEYAAELKIISQQTGFTCRSWVIWYYTFGVNCVHGFSRSHTHLFHFVADPKNFTFNAINPLVRVPSARQLVYGDARANPKGRLPDNTWIMRPQDAPNSFRQDHDVWYFARVSGTFKERAGFHGCQMPEQLLGRIIRTSSNPGNIVLDPFSGSGTTVCVAKKLARRFLGFELSNEYVRQGRQRLTATNVNDPLTGPADALGSAPSTARGRRRKNRTSDREIELQVIEAFQQSADGRSADHLICDPELNATFVATCRKLGIEGHESMWNLLILRLRKSKRLPKSTRSSGRLHFKDMDDYSFGSEVAMRLLSVDFGLTLENILCCSDFAARFDRIAADFAPGFSPFEYRRAALSIRKRAKSARRKGNEKFSDWSHRRLPKKIQLDQGLGPKYSAPGVYVLANSNQPLYVGQCENMAARVEQIMQNKHWLELEPNSVVMIPHLTEGKQALQSVLIGRLNPLLNSQLLHPGRLIAGADLQPVEKGADPPNGQP